MNFFTNKKNKDQQKSISPGNVGISIAQFYIFSGEKYIGWDCFDQERVTVGSGRDADLVLPDANVSPIQAVFVIKGDRVLVSDEGRQGVLKVNDKPARDSIIGPFDFVRIGSYTLKIKLKNADSGYRAGNTIPTPVHETAHLITTPQNNEPSEIQQTFPEDEKIYSAEKVSAKELCSDDDENYRLVFEGKIFEGYELYEVKERLSIALNINDKRINTMFSGRRVVVKKKSDYSSAVRLREVFEKSGAICVIEEIEDTDYLFNDSAASDVQETELQPEKIKESLEVERIVSGLLNEENDFFEESIEEPPAPVDDNDDDMLISSTSDWSYNEEHTDDSEPVLALADFDEDVKPLVEKKEIAHEKGSFPEGFYTNISDEEDEEDENDDCPASFSLKEKLLGKERNIGRKLTNEKVVEIIKFKDKSVQKVTHLQKGSEINLIEEGKKFCRVENIDNNKKHLIFSDDYKGIINLDKNSESGSEFETEKIKSLKGVLNRKEVFKAIIPPSGEIMVSDGFYEYLIRTSFLQAAPVIPLAGGLPEKKSVYRRTIDSTAFRYISKAVIAHFVVLMVLTLTITFPEPEKFKEPLTYFVVMDTKNIHKPVKPKRKPKPVVKRVEKKSILKKLFFKETKPANKVASIRPRKYKKNVKAGAPKAGGGHKGNLVNRNVNETGLLGALGMKTGISIKSNQALASVTNIDAVTSTHSSEARLKVGGLIGNLGDKGIAIPTGDALNTKGSTNVLRSAGIGGSGNVAALSNGKTGKRAVSGGVVSAPLTKRVKFKGGGISRQAVAKVINSHIDEINYCYETALMADPSLMGKVVFEWKILIDGSVGEVHIQSSTVRSSEIHACIKASIKTWTFPRPKGSAVLVSYPFVFDISGF